jgi:molecular chaperone GrpE
MNDWPDHETLLGRFRQWLEETRSEAGALPEEAELLAESSQTPLPGLLQLTEEFTALRHEVKLHTKGARELAERTGKALEAMQQAADLFRGVEAKEAEAAERAAKPLIESLMELDEALRRGRAVIDAARRKLLDDLAGQVGEEFDDLLFRLPAWRRWLCRSWCRKAREAFLQRVGLNYRGIFDSLVEGYQLILGRLQRTMKQADLYRIECVGRPFDPRLMTVIEVVDDPLRPPGLVVEEIRPGYYWKGKVVRFAEVRAVQGRTE